MHSFDTADERDKVPGGGIEFPNFRDDATMEMRDPYASEELQPSALRQMQYNSDFSQDINMKMRMPTKLTVASSHDNDEDFFQSSSRTNNSDILSKMEVPDRIVVSVGEEGAKYSGAQGSSGSLYAEDFLRQPQSSEHLSLVTPPRKLTLAERNLDALDIPEHEETQPTKDGTKASSSAVSNRVAQDVQQNESFEELDDVSLLRRQIFKLHRRITAIEKQQTERSKRDIYVYAVTIAFWVFNGWFMYSSRRPY